MLHTVYFLSKYIDIGEMRNNNDILLKDIT